MNTHTEDVAKTAPTQELGRPRKATEWRDRLRALQDRVLAFLPTGDEADNGFYDDLSGEP